jgi:hypothetical protein
VLLGKILQALESHGGAGGVAGELEDAVDVIGFEPDGVVDVKPGVGPGEHRAGVVGGEELAADELAQYGPAEGLGQDVDGVEAEVEEGAVGPEGAVGDDEMQDTRRSPRACSRSSCRCRA